MSGEEAGFRAGDPIDRYLAALAEKLAGQRDADDLVAEMEDHLRESTEHLIQDGRSLEDAQRAAIRRFGDPDLISHALLAGRGRRRLADPVTVTRWPFLIAELLLITAGLALAASAYAYWQPCGLPVTSTGGSQATGPHIVTDHVFHSFGIPRECLGRSDTVAAIPAATALVSDILETFAYAALGLAWLIFVTAQPWLPVTRILAAVPAVLSLVEAAARTLLARPPDGDILGMGIVLGFLFDRFVMPTVLLMLMFCLGMLLSVLLISDDQLSDRGLNWPGHSSRTRHSTMPWGTYLTRTYLLFLVALAAEPIHNWLMTLSILGVFFGLDEETPSAAANYLIAIGIAGPALLSIVVGVVWRRRGPAAARSWTARGEAITR